MAVDGSLMMSCIILPSKVYVGIALCFDASHLMLKSSLKRHLKLCLHWDWSAVERYVMLLRDLTRIACLVLRKSLVVWS